MKVIWRYLSTKIWKNMRETWTDIFGKNEKWKTWARNQSDNGQEIKLFEKWCRIKWSMVKSDGKSVILWRISGRWRGRYNKWNVFEGNRFWEKKCLDKMSFLFWIYIFSRIAQTHNSEKRFLRAFSMRNCLDLNFLAKCGR